jgi:ABC-type Na+ efflux pump permease subunit
LNKRDRLVLAGPLFVREALTTPRQVKHFLFRAGYLGTLFVLMYTAAQVTFGWQQVRNLSDIARFGELVFQLFTLVQLTLVVFFSVIFAAVNVAQEKDRRTLLLLLVTDLRDSELVLGKLCASLLLPLVLVGVSLPAFVCLSVLGGVTESQMASVLGLSLASGLAAGTWGTLVAFWREKTFQTLAICLIGIALFLLGVEGLALVPGLSFVAILNPFRTALAVMDPFNSPDFARQAVQSSLALLGLSAALAVSNIGWLRVWNPSRGVTEARLAAEGERERTRAARKVWDRPVIWREMCTLAYGRKALLIKLAYAVIAALAVGGLSTLPPDTGLVLGMISPIGFVCIGLALLTLLLVNAQAVTSLTTERDANTLELLLVTELTAREFVTGKLLGVLFNTKELIAIPLLVLGWQAVSGDLSWENWFYVTLGFAVLVLFAGTLGLHFGLSYGNSRQAIANSLATMFFLFVGIFLCMLLIVQARASFAVQLPSFLVFILGGSLGLWATLTARNPSPALTLAAAVLPFGTFYAITSFLLGQTLGVCVVLSAVYGFTAIAMLVPAVSEFDVALGRSGRDG